MSFFAIARAARAVGPAFARRFASNLASYTPGRSYRTAVWGTAAFGTAAALVAATTQTTYCDVPVVAQETETAGGFGPMVTSEIFDRYSSGSRYFHSIPESNAHSGHYQNSCYGTRRPRGQNSVILGRQSVFGGLLC